MPPKTDSALRQLQVLANLLRPILGAQADTRSDDLLARFGSISAIMTASREALYQALDGDGAVAEALLAARSLVSAGWREQVFGHPVDATDPRLAQYLLGRLHSGHEERLHAIYLDAGSRYIRDELVAVGSRSNLAWRTRAIVRRAFDLEAHKLILAHNHPSGRAFASKEDRVATSRFEMIVRELELELLDHLIVGGGQTYSMRHNRLIVGPDT